MKEFTNTFKDPREVNARNITETDFNHKELFYCMIDETEQTFKLGIIVSATVIRVFDAHDDLPARAQCRLENGLEANIN